MTLGVGPAAVLVAVTTVGSALVAAVLFTVVAALVDRPALRTVLDRDTTPLRGQNESR